MRRLLVCAFVLVQVTVAAMPGAARAQAGFDDDRVMLQGFYWESHRHGHAPRHGTRPWYRIVAEQAQAIRDGRFDLVWLPPPSAAGAVSAGYDPREYYNLGNSCGDFALHRAMLEALLGAGVEPVADVVINHRNGSRSWADFRDPDWGTWAITRDDEAFTNPASPVAGTPVQERGAPEELLEYAPGRPPTYAYPAFRDIDHTNRQVRRDLVRYLLQLRSMGYRGWRYDMVLGFHARWIAVYNRASAPTFSVGEYWDDQAAQRGWIWHSAVVPGDLRTASSAFDFSTYYALRDNKGAYGAWYGSGGGGVGLVADTTDGLPWRNRAVTFLENHDTGYRTGPDGAPERGHESDSFANGWQVEQGYAQILTHPGVPTVYWKHYFDWGSDLRERIRALINARKVAGVHAGSAVHPQDNARASGIYAARVIGRHGDLYVRVGGDDSQWQPSASASGHAGYREYASGEGWRVWVRLPGNPAVRQAPLRAPLPVPEYRDPRAIDVPENLLDPPGGN